MINGTGKIYENPQAKEYHDELKQWIRDTVLQLGNIQVMKKSKSRASGVLQKNRRNRLIKVIIKRKFTDTINDVVIQQRTQVK